VIRRCDNTVHKKRVNSCVLKYLFWRELSNQKNLQKIRKCFLPRTTNVMFSKFQHSVSLSLCPSLSLSLVFVVCTFGSGAHICTIVYFRVVVEQILSFCVTQHNTTYYYTSANQFKGQEDYVFDGNLLDSRASWFN